MIRKRASIKKRRRGLLSMELLITLPIFGVLLMGLFEYSLLFAARGDVVAACRAGCRRATLANATLQDVEYEVRATLGNRLSRQVQVDAVLGDRTGDEVTVVYWRGEIRTVRFGALAQEAKASPTDDWRRPMTVGLGLLPVGLGFVWTG